MIRITTTITFIKKGKPPVILDGTEEKPEEYKLKGIGEIRDFGSDAEVPTAFREVLILSKEPGEKSKCTGDDIGAEGIKKVSFRLKER